MICEICYQPIAFFGERIYTVNGPTHPACYFQQNPIKARTTFLEVLNNCDDQVIVRRLLEELVPMDAKIEVVRRFNEAMRALQTRRTQS